MRKILWLAACLGGLLMFGNLFRSTPLAKANAPTPKAAGTEPNLEGSRRPALDTSSPVALRTATFAAG